MFSKFSLKNFEFLNVFFFYKETATKFSKQKFEYVLAEDLKVLC